MRNPVVTVLVCGVLCSLVVHAQQYDDLVYGKGTFFGNMSNDSYLLGVTVDKKGNVYGTGLCTSIPATSGVVSQTNNGAYDIMVFKLDPTMSTLIWATYIGGSNNEAGGSIAVNDDGEVFVSGYTYSSNFPISNPQDQGYLSSGMVSYFALKLSNDGSQLLYSRILGNGYGITQQSQNASKGAHIAINDAGNAFVLAHTIFTANYTITSNAYQQNPVGGTELVLTKLSPTGNILYASYLGGVQNETAGGICYANGRIYCSGTTGSADFPFATGKVPDGADCFLLQAFDGPTLNFQRSYIFGSNGSDIGISVAYDKVYNRVCFTGIAANATIPATASLLPSQSYGGFVGAIDEGLNSIMYLTIIGSGVVPTGVVARRNGSVYVAGYTSSILPVSPNAFQASSRGGLDGMMISVDITGRELRYGTFIGGSNSDYAVANVILLEDKECSLGILFGITTHSPNYPSTRDAYQPIKLNGGEDQPALAMFTIPSRKEDFFHGEKLCGEDTFRLVFPCLQPEKVTWTFSDGSPIVNDTFVVRHTFPKNGNYVVTTRIIYPGPDTVYRTKEITVSSYPQVRVAPGAVYMCVGDKSTYLSASGAVRYQWFPGNSVSDSTSPNPRISPTQRVTRYYVRGWDINGCESIDSTIVYLLETKVKISSDTTICEGQSVHLYADGAAQIKWTPAIGLNKTTGKEVIASPKNTISYTITTVDGACYDTAMVTVRVAHKPTIRIPDSPVICVGGTATLRVELAAQSPDDTTGLSYQWLPDEFISNTAIAEPEVSPTTTRWYKVRIRNKYQCEVSDSIFVKVQKQLSLTLSKDTAICLGSSIRLQASGGAQYRWLPAIGLSDSTKPDPICTPTTKTTYTVIASSGECADTQHVTVGVYSLAIKDAMGDTSVCQGERVRLWVDSPDPSLRYSWSPAEDFETAEGSLVYARPKRSTNYIVTAQNAAGCTATDTVHVDTDNALQVQLSQDTSVCAGETVVFRIMSKHEAGTQFSWIPNDGVFNAISKEYQVVATKAQTYRAFAQAGSCNGMDSVTLGIKPQPKFSIVYDTAGVCIGSRSQIKVHSNQSGIRYRWLRASADDPLLDNAHTATPTTTELLSPTTFVVLAELNGCVATDSLTIGVHSKPVITLSEELTVCKGESITAEVSSPAMQNVLWAPPQGLSSVNTPNVTIDVNEERSYTVTVTDANGCTQTALYSTHIKPETAVHLWVSSATVTAGDNAEFVVYANASAELSTPLAFEVACNAGIFKADALPSVVKNGQMLTHVAVPPILLTTQDKEIARIKGRSFVTTPTSSDVIIQNIIADDKACIKVRTTSGSIETNSCLKAGRAIKLFVSLHAALSPNPSTDNTTLTVNSEETGMMTIAITDELGRAVQTFDIAATSEVTTIPLPMKELAQGFYRVSIHKGFQQASVLMIKQ